MVGAWVRLLVNSAVVAAVAVAAQLGAGNALGIIQWDGPPDARGWSTLLTWLAFSYAVAVLAGATVGRIAVRRDGIGSRLTASLVAAAGAAAAIALAWLPGQSAEPPTNVNAGLVISLTAGAGVVVGLLLALLALAARPIAVGLQTIVVWTWLLAIVAAAAGLATHEPFVAPRLGVPDAPTLLPSSPWTGPRIMVIAAAVVAILVAGIARATGSGRVGAALSGFGGPAVIAAAYLIAGPGEQGGPQAEPYVAALVAVAAGLVASVLVALPGRRATPAPRPPAPVEEGPLHGDVIEVVRTPTSPVSTQERARPAWAEGSGVYARASTAAAREPVTVAPRTGGWNADTLPGTSSASSAGRHAQPHEPTAAGIYRSASSPGSGEPPQPALPELPELPRRVSGRHAAPTQ